MGEGRGKMNNDRRFGKAGYGRPPKIIISGQLEVVLGIYEPLGVRLRGAEEY